MVNFFFLLSFMYINYRLSFNRRVYKSEKGKKMNEWMIFTFAVRLT
jgi:hypothetical protein